MSWFVWLLRISGSGTKNIIQGSLLRFPGKPLPHTRRVRGTVSGAPWRRAGAGHGLPLFQPPPPWASQMTPSPKRRARLQAMLPFRNRETSKLSGQAIKQQQAPSGRRVELRAAKAEGWMLARRRKELAACRPVASAQGREPGEPPPPPRPSRQARGWLGLPFHRDVGLCAC